MLLRIFPDFPRPFVVSRPYGVRYLSWIHQNRRKPSSKKPANVDEVVQETFVLAFEAIGRFEWMGDTSFFSWLTRIARNVSIERVKNAHRRRYLELPDQLPDSGFCSNS